MCSDRLPSSFCFENRLTLHETWADKKADHCHGCVCFVCCRAVKAWTTHSAPTRTMSTRTTATAMVAGHKIVSRTMCEYPAAFGDLPENPCQMGNGSKRNGRGAPARGNDLTILMPCSFRWNDTCSCLLFAGPQKRIWCVSESRLPAQTTSNGIWSTATFIRCTTRSAWTTTPAPTMSTCTIATTDPTKNGILMKTRKRSEASTTTGAWMLLERIMCTFRRAIFKPINSGKPGCT